MDMRPALAGVIVAAVIGAVGAVPVAAEDDSGGSTAVPVAAGEPAPEEGAVTDGTTPGDDGQPADDGTTPTTPPTTTTTSSPTTGTTAPAPGDTADAGDGGETTTATLPTTAPPGPAPAAGPTTSSTAGTGGDDSTGPPDVASDQTATVDATGTAVADTGHNTAANGSVQVIVLDQAAVAPGAPATGTGTGGGGTAGNDAEGANTSVGLALVVSGDATAIGGATDDSISQKALVKAVGTGETEIIQIALVVNLGVGIANTGGNSATGLDVVNVIGAGQSGSAGGGAGGVATNGLTAANDATGAGAVATGDATAVGNVSDVRVVQAADVAAGTGTVASGQATDIASLGVAFGNTGLNIVIGNTVVQLILVDQQAAGSGGGSAATAANQAGATNAATGVAAITTGSASATGNASSTAIDQLATADAGDGGFVSILQRALVLNLGIALANSGMNTAVGNQSVDLVRVQQQSIAAAFWTSLQSLFGGSGWLDLSGASGTATNSVTAANTSDGTALVTTGDARATGLASSTQVAQTAAGSAQAGGQAYVTQHATVTNAGLAVANTGGNSAAGLLALNAVVADQWAGLGAYLDGFLGQLGTGATTATPAMSTWNLGDVLVDLFGEIHADEVLIDGFAALSGGQVEEAVAQALGFATTADGVVATGPSATGPRIRVRQITGTLTINLGIAATGGNTAQTSAVDVVVLDQQSTAPTPQLVTRALGQGVRAAAQALADGTVEGAAALDPENQAVLVNATTGAAVVVTGDARASNATVVAVCQTYAVPVAVCDPPTAVPPADPGTPGTPGVPAAASGTFAGSSTGSAVVSDTAALSAGGLPRTGADPAPLLRAAGVLLGVGATLVLTTRRRRLATVRATIPSTGPPTGPGTGPGGES